MNCACESLPVEKLCDDKIDLGIDVFDLRKKLKRYRDTYQKRVWRLLCNHAIGLPLNDSDDMALFDENAKKSKSKTALKPQLKPVVKTQSKAQTPDSSLALKKFQNLMQRSQEAEQKADDIKPVNTAILQGPNLGNNKTNSNRNTSNKRSITISSRRAELLKMQQSSQSPQKSNPTSVHNSNSDANSLVRHEPLFPGKWDKNNKKKL